MTNSSQPTKKPRYFFDCPIKALYMAENFQVRFEIDNGRDDGFEDFDSFKLFENFKLHQINAGIKVWKLLDELTCDTRLKKIYVCRESEEIFQPKPDDRGLSPSPEHEGALIPVTVRRFNKEFKSIEVFWPGRGFYDDDFKTIFRDEKQFFSATKEEK